MSDQPEATLLIQLIGDLAKTELEDMKKRLDRANRTAVEAWKQRDRLRADKGRLMTCWSNAENARARAQQRLREHESI